MASGPKRSWNIGDVVFGRKIVAERISKRGSVRAVVECANGHRSIIASTTVAQGNGCRRCRSWKIGDRIGDRTVVGEKRVNASNGFYPILECDVGHRSIRDPRRAAVERCGECTLSRKWSVGDVVGDRVIDSFKLSKNGAKVPVLRCAAGHLSQSAGVRKVAKCQECRRNTWVSIHGVKLYLKDLALILGVSYSAVKQQEALGATPYKMILMGLPLRMRLAVLRRLDSNSAAKTQPNERLIDVRL